jgi:FMN phosphatase YigB (HAD superfamily)
MKRILTDADGVLLDWEGGLHRWMEMQGHRKYNALTTRDIESAYPDMSREEARRNVSQFCDSSHIGFLDPERDARSGVARLVEAGYVFTVITSLGTDPFTMQLRIQNLETLFGKETFDGIEFLEIAADKDEALGKWEGSECYWIEDKAKNAEAGLQFGLKPILIDHLHNQWYDHPQIPRVQNWAEIADIILNSKTL